MAEMQKKKLEQLGRIKDKARQREGEHNIIKIALTKRTTPAGVVEILQTRQV